MCLATFCFFVVLREETGELHFSSAVFWFIFPVLDEATSQVGLAMEHDLYAMCRQLHITVLSVGHRASLRAFHQRELHFEPGGRWALVPINDDADGAVDSADNVCNIRL